MMHTVAGDILDPSMVSQGISFVVAMLGFGQLTAHTITGCLIEIFGKSISYQPIYP